MGLANEAIEGLGSTIDTAGWSPIAVYGIHTIMTDPPRNWSLAVCALFPACFFFVLEPAFPPFTELLSMVLLEPAFPPFTKLLSMVLLETIMAAFAFS
jgi:hypothetical protein